MLAVPEMLAQWPSTGDGQTSVGGVDSGQSSLIRYAVMCRRASAERLVAKARKIQTTVVGGQCWGKYAKGGPNVWHF